MGEVIAGLAFVLVVLSGIFGAVALTAHNRQARHAPISALTAADEPLALQRAREYHRIASTATYELSLLLRDDEQIPILHPTRRRRIEKIVEQFHDMD